MIADTKAESKEEARKHLKEINKMRDWIHDTYMFWYMRWLSFLFVLLDLRLVGSVGLIRPRHIAVFAFTSLLSLSFSLLFYSALVKLDHFRAFVFVPERSVLRWNRCSTSTTEEAVAVRTLVRMKTVWVITVVAACLGILAIAWEIAVSFFRLLGMTVATFTISFVGSVRSRYVSGWVRLFLHSWLFDSRTFVGIFSIRSFSSDSIVVEPSIN